MVDIIFVAYIHNISFIHSSVDGQLNGFHTFATVNSAAINIGEQVSVRDFFLGPVATLAPK